MTDWPVWLLAVIDALAVHRLTKLVTDDVITTRPRWAVIRWAYIRAGHEPELVETGDLDAMVEADMVEAPDTVPRLAVLITCRWCTSWWVAAGVVTAHGLAPHQWPPIAAALALSSAGTLLAALED